MRVLIAGIGRSGTTALFEQIGRGCLRRWSECECRYEPYVWNIPEALKTAVAKGAPFSNENVDYFGLRVHMAMPLFADTSHPSYSDWASLHNEWMERNFGLSLPGEPVRVVKEIRALGRLSAILDSAPDIRCVLVTRNPLEIINSSLGLFSLFSDELFPSDRPRFRRELDSLHGERGTAWPAAEDLPGWSALWVEHFFAAGMAAKRKYAERILVVPYESYVGNRIEGLSHIFRFLGLEEPSRTIALDSPSGPTVPERFLSNKMIDKIAPSISTYVEQCRQYDHAGVFSSTYVDDLLKQFGDRPPGREVLHSSLLSLTAVQWRSRFNRV